MAQLSEAQALLSSRPDLAPLRDRVDRAHARAGARVLLAKFLTMTTDADERILGSLWALLPHEDPEGRRRINRTGQGASNLEMGIARAREALALYGLPDQPAACARRETSSLRLRADSASGQARSSSCSRSPKKESVKRVPRPSKRSRGRRPVACSTRARHLGNQSYSLYLYRSRFRKLLGREADALADRKRSDEVPARTFLDHHLKAVELARDRKNLAQSATEYQIALAARPDEYWTLYRLAKALENQKQVSQAEALYRNILALRPNDSTTHNTLGTILSEQGKNEEAIAEFEAVFRADPDYLIAYGNLMKVQGNLKQVDAAEATFRRFMAQTRLSRGGEGLGFSGNCV